MHGGHARFVNKTDCITGSQQLSHSFTDVPIRLKMFELATLKKLNTETHVCHANFVNKTNCITDSQTLTRTFTDVQIRFKMFGV